MARINQNFMAWKHSNRIIKITVEDVATIDGCEVYWTMSESAGSAALISKSSETTPATINIVGKVARVFIVPADVDTVDPGSYYHELLVIDTAGNRLPAVTGTIELRDVTIKP